MAATGNEIVLLKQLKLYNDEIIQPALDDKLDAPKSSGTDGYVLVYGESGNQWVDSTTLGGVKIATDAVAKGYLGY